MEDVKEPETPPLSLEEETEPLTPEQVKKLAADNQLANENKKKRHVIRRLEAKIAELEAEREDERASSASKDARIAELEAETHEEESADLGELRHKAAVLEVLSELRPLDPKAAIVLLSEISTVTKEGKLVDAEDLEELTPEIIREILPPQLLPARGVSGAGSKTPKPANFPGASPIERAVESQAFYDANREKVLSAERGGR